MRIRKIGYLFFAHRWCQNITPFVFFKLEIRSLLARRLQGLKRFSQDKALLSRLVYPLWLSRWAVKSVNLKRAMLTAQGQGDTDLWKRENTP
jgi:hypothetical protein